MPKYFRYTDKTGLLTRRSDTCPPLYHTSQNSAIQSALKKYSILISNTQAKFERAANLHNHLRNNPEYAGTEIPGDVVSINFLDRNGLISKSINYPLDHIEQANDDLKSLISVAIKNESPEITCEYPDASSYPLLQSFVKRLKHYCDLFEIKLDSTERDGETR